MSKIYKGVPDLEIEIDLLSDVSSADEITVTVTKPDETTFDWLLSESGNTLANDEIFTHTTTATEFDTAGVYTLSTVITMSGVDIPSIVQTISVYSYGDIVIMHDDDFNLIKAQLGYPLQDNIILTDVQIKELCVKRALRDYFRKFPRITEVEETIGYNSGVTYDFPDDLTFGVKDVRVVNKGSITSQTDSFFSLVRWNNMYGDSRGLSGRGKYGTNFQFDTYGLSNTMLQRDTAQSLMNEATIKYRINPTSRQLYIYSELDGIVNIVWAKYSNNFTEVKFEQREDVIDLSACYLKMNMADSAGLYTDETQDVTFDVDGLRSEAKEKKEEIIERWATYQDVIVIRDSR